ncbi:MAG TPA: hypothetical protein VGK04_05555 [Thermoanaerobaculia bacterium]|jgi:hypothetical protein
MELSELTIDNAKPLEQTVFYLETEDGRIEMKLVSVVANMPNRPRSKRLKRDSFSLFFLGPADPLLRQGMYTLTSERESLPGVFLVPVGRDQEGRFEYEAVFT